MVRVHATEEELRGIFSDTLRTGISLSGILVTYHESNHEDESVRTVMGVPYSISDGHLELGLYLKDSRMPTPEDYHDRKKQIPIENIVGYRRIELSDRI